MTAFAREDTTATFPSNLTVKKVNYDSVESLTAALKGQDAVVSTIATVAVGNQGPLVDAAVAAGVKRFIPSEFGINTRIVGDDVIGQILVGKIKTLDYIIEKSKANPSFTWTGVSSGLFFDWVSAEEEDASYRTKAATLTGLRRDSSTAPSASSRTARQP